MGIIEISGHYTVPAPEINDELLEEFARTLIGQPSKFSKFRSAGPVAGVASRGTP